MISLLRDLREKSRWLVPAASLMVLTACNGSETSQESNTQPSESEVERLDEFATQRVVGGEAGRGRHIIAVYECGICHVIPGIEGAHGIVGPPLTDFAHRKFIGGVVPNEPTLLVRWVQNAPSIAPHTGMPDVGLSAEEARHVAAYLYTLR